MLVVVLLLKAEREEIKQERSKPTETKDLFPLFVATLHKVAN